eukprot:TRINITY_DN2680_c0_g1_i11.p1 TRINITY_DN2680_c0_g1~~TRINITY_DN2680_c0_g1_i11.p1  ORF type:complete len:549 (+),score=167.09 TRINITY_DN2680_c0_g1_i11:2368-4014(+)
MKRYFLALVFLFVLKLFSGGSQCVNLMMVLDIVVGLYYSRKCTGVVEMVLLYIVGAVGDTITVVGVINHPGMGIEWVGVMLLLQLALGVAFILPYVADKLLYNVPYVSSMCFPAAFTGMQVFVVSVSPGGSWGAAGFCTTYNVPAALALLSFGGLSIVHFLMAWTATFTITNYMLLTADEPESHSYARYSSVPSSPVERDDESLLRVNESMPDPPYYPADHTLFKRIRESECQRNTYILVVLFFIAYGSLYSCAPTLFGHKDDREVINLTCLSVANGQEVSVSSLLQTTREAAINGSKIVMWSERPTLINKQDEVQITQYATDLAVSQNIFVGLAYELGDQEPGYESTSQFTLIDPSGNGSVKLHVGRVHTSPFGKGPHTNAPVVRAVNTSLGRMGAIMGFDLSFPHFVQDVASNRVKLVLSPAEDYGPIYSLQWNQAALRAVEQGTTIAYCSSMHGLLVVDPYGRTVAYAPPSQAPTTVLRASVPIGSIATPYSAMGDAIGFTCLGFAVLFLILGKVQVPASRINIAAWVHSLISTTAPPVPHYDPA